MKPFRSKKYMDYVRDLPCAVTGQDHIQSDPHHLWGYGLSGMGQKPSDFFIMPLKHEIHQQLHLNGKEWLHDMYGVYQIDCVVETLRTALKDGVIDESRLLLDIMAVTNCDHRRILEKCVEN